MDELGLREWKFPPLRLAALDDGALEAYTHRKPVAPLKIGFTGSEAHRD